MRLPFLIPMLAVALLFGRTAQAQTPEWLGRLLGAASLPVSAHEARREGAPDGMLREVLVVMQRAKVPAHEARQILDEERAALREHGPVDNFGAFVQSRLDAGLRGRELAAAIHAEHRLRGMGRSGRSAQPNAAPGDGGGAGRGAERGRSDEARDRTSDPQGRRGARRDTAPDTSRGRSGSQGRPAERPPNATP